MTVWSSLTEPLRRFGRIVGMGLEALFAYRLRSFFVVAAVALGIASLTIIIASIDGAERKADEIVEMFGPDAAFVIGGSPSARAFGNRGLTLTYGDVQRIRAALPGAYLTVPMRAKSNVTVRFGDKSVEVPIVVGSTEGYADAWNWPLAEGRDFGRADIDRGEKIVLLADGPAEKLFGKSSPLGETVYVNDLPVRVVGRLAYRGMASMGGAIDDRIVIPITTLTQRFNMDRKYVRALRVKFSNPEEMAFHKENLRSLLRHQHRLSDGAEDDFTVLTADEILKFISMFKGGLVAFLGVTAAVAIIVGGFVLANLFYLSVSERRSEIGLKKALGATDRAILWQFLVEAVSLTILGAFFGMILGMGLGQLLDRLGILQILFSWKIFFLSLAASCLIGLIFGLKPARQAASLPPVEALKGV